MGLLHTDSRLSRIARGHQPRESPDREQDLTTGRLMD